MQTVHGRQISVEIIEVFPEIQTKLPIILLFRFAFIFLDKYNLLQRSYGLHTYISTEIRRSINTVLATHLSK